METKTIKTHKITGQRFELKKDHGDVSSLYFLDENGKRIKRTKNSPAGAFNAKGEQSYEIAICRNENLI